MKTQSVHSTISYDQIYWEILLFLGPSTWVRNKISRKSLISNLLYHNCKKVLNAFLQDKTYEETEEYLSFV